MNLDIRIPIGLLFTVYGVILTLVGLFVKGSLRPEDGNVNLLWGVIQLVFGLGMLYFGWRGMRRQQALEKAQSTKAGA